MRTNEQLLELYNKKMPLLKKSLDEYNENTKDKATNPLLIKVSEKWEDSEVKIMIIGQETYTWCGECGNEGIFSANIKESLNIYNRFFLNNYGYTSPFWNEFRRLSKSIKTNKKVDFSWNNVIKIGRIGAGNIPNINDIIYKDFNILIEEIKITKPNIVIFFTGPSYNNHIKRFIGSFNVIPKENFKGAHKRSINENTAYYKEIDKPSEILRVGDLIHVELVKKSVGLAPYLSKEGTAFLNKSKSASLVKSQQYLLLNLDQVPEVQGALYAVDSKTGEVISYVGKSSADNDLKKIIVNIK
jgi:hypothetical protein